MIRLLHTSDWHLGLELGGHDRLEEQKHFLDWLLTTCLQRQIDALLVSGDVYDVANPSVASQAAFSDFLVRFHQAMPNSTLVVVAGNHDSASRLELPKPFGEALGKLHLRGVATDSVVDFLIPLRDAKGAVGAWCVALPFLRVGDLDCKLLEGETPQEAYVRSVEARYRSVRESIGSGDRDLPLVTMGHLTLAGSHRAGSERILIGGVESVPVQALSQGSAYVALGHIHRAQTVGSEFVRYSGSPYPVDFDEHRYHHLVLEVEVEAGSPTVVREIEVPEFVNLLRFCDPLVSWDKVEQAVEAFDWSIWSTVPRDLQPLVELRYDASILVDGDLRNRCESLCRSKPFRLIASPRGISDIASEKVLTSLNTDLRERETPEALLLRHWKSKFDAPIPDPVLTRFRQTVDEVSLEGTTR